MFEGVVGSGYLGDIALDDITYRSGVCQFTPSNAVPPSLQTTTPTSTVSGPTTKPVTATSCECNLLGFVTFLFVSTLDLDICHYAWWSAVCAVAYCRGIVYVQPFSQAQWEILD